MPYRTTSLLLHRDLTPFGALAGARVGVSPLATDGQVATMTKAAVAAKVHQTLDLGLNLAAQITFDFVVRLHDPTNRAELLVVEVIGSDRPADASLVQDLARDG